MKTQNDTEKLLSDEQVQEAVKSGKIELLQTAISQGFDINKQFDIIVPIECWVYNDKGELTDSYESGYYQTVDIFSIACKSKQYDIVHFLLDKGAVFDNRTASTEKYSTITYENPIVESARTGDINIFKMAHSRGFDVNTLFLEKRYSYVDDDDDELQQLRDGWTDREGNRFDINSYNFYFTLLSEACAYGHKKYVEYLVENGAKLYSEVAVRIYPYPNSSESWVFDETELRNPLLIACRNGNLDIFKYLVENGGNLNIKDKKGNTLLDIAMNEKREDIQKYLISKGQFISRNTQNYIIHTKQKESYQHIKIYWGSDFFKRPDVYRTIHMLY